MADYLTEEENDLAAEDLMVEEASEPGEEPKAKHLPYAVWEVAGEEHKLKLTGRNIAKVERRLKKNILVFISEEGLPPLSSMLLILQGAALPYDHKITLEKMYDLYEKYVEEGGDQEKLLGDVIFPVLSVSGFFTENQKESVKSIAAELDSPL